MFMISTPRLLVLAAICAAALGPEASVASDPPPAPVSLAGAPVVAALAAGGGAPVAAPDAPDCLAELDRVAAERGTPGILLLLAEEAAATCLVYAGRPGAPAAPR